LKQNSKDLENLSKAGGKYWQNLLLANNTEKKRIRAVVALKRCRLRSQQPQLYWRHKLIKENTVVNNSPGS